MLQIGQWIGQCQGCYKNTQECIGSTHALVGASCLFTASAYEKQVAIYFPTFLLSVHVFEADGGFDYQRESNG